MEKLNALNQVLDFHETFNHPVLDSPKIPSYERCELRVNLLMEEINELQLAINNKDIVEVADALCDIQYVLTGAVLEFGLGEKFVEAFDEVHRSNMSKACKTIQEAEQTVEHYKSKESSDAFFEKLKSLFVVYRTRDHKILKSIKYSPANLKNIIYDTL